MAKSSDESRKYMLLAIEQMRQTLHEPRPDDKITPLVGAVLIKEDGAIELAHRGELREGDHAEYTLLERKNRSNKLDGSVLYTTLEPCMSRTTPKLGCAERIVLARIKEVWIGIEDPDPTVDRKGIQRLEERGIKVHMFDLDLQEVILKENDDYIRQAKARAGEVKAKEKPIVLSELENKVSTARTEDLSLTALEKYIAAAKLDTQPDSEAFRQRLRQLDFLAGEPGNYVPTGNGILLFAEEPRRFMQQAGVLAKVELANGETETMDFSGPMVLIPGELETWLSLRLPNVINRTQMQRKEGAKLLMTLMREAIVNALVHRDYDIEGAKIQLEMTPHFIRIKSPGEPVSPVTLEQIKSFKAPILSRNPQLQYAFTKMGLAEERGLGMQTLKSVPEALGLPLPKFIWEAPYLVLELYKTPEDAVASLDPKVLEGLNTKEREGWIFLSSNLSTTSGEYAEGLSIDSRTAQRQLTKFVELGLVRREGKGKATRYEVIGR